ncbi:hypothetical protein D3C77_673920 [compost metagenome]
MRGGQAALAGLLGGGEQQLVGHQIGAAIGAGHLRLGPVDERQLPEDDEDQQHGDQHDRRGQGEAQRQEAQQGQHRDRLHSSCCYARRWRTVRMRRAW